MCLAAALAAAPGAHAAPPKLGQYIGETRDEGEASLVVVSRAVKSGVFEVDCRLGTGRVSLGRVARRTTDRGSEFEWRGRRKVTYSDGHAADTATVVASGRVDRTGAKARGVVRISGGHCDRSREVPWVAKHTTTPVSAPKAGGYSGSTKQGRVLSLSVSGGAIEVAAIEFTCGDAIGRTVLNDVRMRRTREGFAFDISAHGSVTYSDEHPDENAPVDLSGVFAPSGSKAKGRVRVKSPRCGDSGQIEWAVTRAGT